MTIYSSLITYDFGICYDPLRVYYKKNSRPFDVIVYGNLSKDTEQSPKSCVASTKNLCNGVFNTPLFKRAYYSISLNQRSLWKEKKRKKKLIRFWPLKYWRGLKRFWPLKDRTGWEACSE